MRLLAKQRDDVFSLDAQKQSEALIGSKGLVQRAMEKCT